MEMWRNPGVPEVADFHDVTWTPVNSNPRSFPTSYQTPNNPLGNPNYQNHHVYQNPAPPNYTQGVFDDHELETAFGSLCLGHPSTPIRENYGYENDSTGFNTNNNNGLSLNRIRSYSASRGLGLPRASSATALVDRPFRGLENGRGDLPMVYLDHGIPNHGVPNTSGIYPSPRRSQSYIELDNGNYQPSRPSLSNYRNGIGTNSAGCRPRSGFDNGLESADARLLLSLYNNRQVGQPRNNNHHRHYHYSNNNNHGIYSLDQVKGRVASVARDQEGCRFLQKLLEEKRPEHVEMVYLEVKDHVRDLMVDQFGNYLMQKLFECCKEEQMTQIILSLINQQIGLLPEICVHPNGTRAMQKMIGYITTQQQRSLLVAALTRATVSLTKDQNGHHVIQQCLRYFPADDTKHLIKEIADHCLEIAMDRSGCCVLQLATARAKGEYQERLLSQIITNALVLSEDPYGNYVVQNTVGMKLPHANAALLNRLRGNFVALSMNKYGSNVVEKCLKECGEKNAEIIVEELMDSFDFLNVLQDQFGNYVVQCALEYAKGIVRDQLVGRIQSNQAHLHSHLFGKKVLARTRGRHRV